MSIGEAVRIARGVAEGLAAAHERGIVHRDVKPQNILLTEDGEPKLADFGIARSMWLTQLTRSNVVFGSPHYLSPEQARGLRVDERADIYALGAVLYEMLTGRPPFIGDSPVAVALKHIDERPLPPSVLRADVPEAIDAVVLRALAKDPRRRYASARDFAGAVGQALPVRSRLAPPARARVAFALPAVLLVALVAGGAAIATPLLLPRFETARAAPSSAAARGEGTDGATAEVASSPDATAAPTASETPAPTAAPTPAVAAPSTPPSALAVAPPGGAQVLAATPVDTVARFYRLVTTHDLDAALALWDARMRASFPPATYLYHRFAATSSIALNSARVVSQTATAATVAVDITEIDGATRRHWVGYWYLVRGADGWLLDQPALSAG